MSRFWSRYTGPLIAAIAPARLCAIGSDDVHTVRRLLDHARRTGGHVDIVAPQPGGALRALLADHDDARYTLHPEGDQAPATPDVVLLDGDPDRSTVDRDLSRLAALAARQGEAMPIVLVHGCASPSARRDPFDEGEPDDRVLTAVETFVAADPGLHLWTLPFFAGLGIIVPQARLTPAIATTIDGFYSGDTMLAACAALEAEAVQARIETAAARRRLERRIDAIIGAERLSADALARSGWLGAGWSTPEPALIWATGKRSILSIPADRLATIDHLAFAVEPVPYREQRLGVVALKAGRRVPLVKTTLAAARSVEIALGPALLDGGHLALQFEHPDYVQPIAYAAGDDARNLSVALTGVALY